MPWASAAGAEDVEKPQVTVPAPAAPEGGHWASEAPQDDRPMPGITESLLQGIVGGGKDLGKSVASVSGYQPPADKPDQISPAASPFEWRDLWSPSRGAAKTAYQFGKSAPTLATGVAGGLLGSYGGPAGTVAGGAIGAMLGSAVQSVGPAFANELKKAPDNPDAAWTKAMEHAATEGAFAGAGWAAFPLKFFNGPIKNMLFQAAGVQPVIGMTKQATENAMEGRPLSENMGQAYAQSVAGTLPIMAGHQAVSMGARGIKNSLSDAFSPLEDTVRDLQMKTTPMAHGDAATESRAAAKDFANERRNAVWRWNQFHDLLMKGTDAEQRQRMWDAADAESVARQQGMTPEQIEAHGIGLSTLSPRERAMTEVLQRESATVLDEAKQVGIFEGEGLPSYVPRIVAMIGADGTVSRPKSGQPQLTPEVNGISTTTPQMKGRRHLTFEETEAAARAKLGDEATVVRDIATLPMATARLQEAVAGRTLINKVKELGSNLGVDLVAEGRQPDPSWFTINHPAFKTYRPRIGNDGQIVKDENGQVVFDSVPLYIRGDFKGPLEAVLQSGNNSKVYNALMDLKSKATSVIMYSPLIHNAVEWGRALPAMPGKVATGWIYFKGNRERNKEGAMSQAISEGLVPIGKRYGIQDITGMMEGPNTAPGRSLTSRVLAAPVEGVFGENAGNAVKRGVDKAGDFWHNTLLWDRIADLQFGLYSDFRAKLIRKGFDETTAGRTAAHLANRYAGALPMESMSENARKLANLTMFSRSFTLGNIGAMKDTINGLPRDIQAQILRDAGPEMLSKATSYAKRKARGILMMDIGLSYAMNSALQSGIAVMRGDRTLSQEGQEYVERMEALLKKGKENPFEILAHPFASLESMTAMAHNEPGKRDRVLVGYRKDGTAIYMRNPAGKIGEEFIGYLTGPLDMMKRKEGTLFRPVMQTISNDKGFGRKVYDPNAVTSAEQARNVGNIVQTFMESQVPVESIKGAWELGTGQGTPDERKLNALKTLGPLTGLTFSKGAPGGPAIGELYRAKAKQDYKLQEAMPDIRKMIVRGDIAGARHKMTEINLDPRYQQYIIRTTVNPEKRISKRLKDTLYRSGDQEAIENFERSLRQRQQP